MDSLSGGTNAPKIYLETSVVSYLAARPSRDLITAAHQQLTHVWWEARRPEFEILVSQLVLDEAAGGDALVVKKRLAYLRDLPLLAIDKRVEILARDLIVGVGLPPRAGADAVHIAVASRHEVDFLLTWNCAHIANAQLRPRIERVCREQGYRAPVLCTPAELMGESDDDRADF